MTSKTAVLAVDFSSESQPAGEDGRYQLTITPDWEGVVGTAYGGFVAAVAMRAAGAEATLPYPVSLACQFLRPVQLEVPAVFQVAKLRSGRRTEHLRVDVTQDDSVAVVAMVIVVDPGPGLLLLPPRRHPAVDRGPDRLPTAMDRLGAEGAAPPPGRMRMWQRLDWRVPSVRSDRWMPEDTSSGIGGWVRIDAGEEKDPWVNVARALIPADAAVAAPFDRAGRLRALRQGRDPLAATTMDLVAHFHTWSAASPWLCFDIEAPIAAEGIGHTRSRVWAPDGALVATVIEQLLFVARAR